MDSERILELAGDVAEQVLAPAAERVDREARWPAESLAALLEAGLGGLVVPRRYGGLGQGLLGLTRVCEVLGAGCSSSAMCFGMHAVGSAVIAAKPSREQAEQYLAPIAAGEHLTTLALSESGSGAHFYFPHTRLEQREGELRIDGQKAFVTNGGHADSYVVSVVSADPEAEPGEFSCVAVPGDTPGLHWREAWNGIGMRGNSSRSLDLEDVRLPAGALLGRAGDEIWYVFEVVAPYFLMAMTGVYLGLAGRALDLVIEDLQQRYYRHSQDALSQQDVLQHRLGELWAQVERTRRQAYHAASEIDRGNPEGLPAILSAKAEAADAGTAVVNAAMTLAGGRAYAENSALGRLLRDVRAAPVMAPTTDMLRLWVGRYLLGQPLLGESGA